MPAILWMLLLIAAPFLGSGAPTPPPNPQPQFELYAESGAARAGQAMQFALVVTPAEGQRVEVTGVEVINTQAWGAGVDFVALTVSERAVIPLALTPMKEGSRRPMLRVRYTVGTVSAEGVAAGDWVEVAAAVPSRSVDFDWKTLVATLTGAVISLGSTFAAEWFKEWRLSLVNTEQVHSLLSLFSDRAEYAAMHGIELKLDDAEKIYATEGLYSVLREHQLEDALRKVIEQGRLFNQNIDRRQSLGHSGNLAEAARGLRARLNVLDPRPWWKKIRLPGKRGAQKSSA